MSSPQNWTEWIKMILGFEWDDENNHVSDAEFMDSMMNGEQIDCVEADRLIQMMNEDLDGKSAELISAKNHLERVAIIEKVFRTEEFVKILKGLSSRFAKSEEMSKFLEDTGRQLNILTDTEKCLKYYNLATMFLESYDPNLPRLYGVRSKLFHKLKKGEDALEDLHSALTNKPPCPKEMNQGLRDMAKECRAWVKRESVRMSHVEETTSILKWRPKRDKCIFKIQGKQNKEIPCAIDGIRVSCNKEQGNHLFTTCKIDPGTTVVVEKPFCKILSTTTLWDTTHCAHCFAKIQRVIPCYASTCAAYCSETCRLRECDQGIHYLSKCLPFLHMIQMPTSKLLGFKLICKVGPVKLYNCWQVENGEEPTPGDSGMKYSPDEYDQILSMKSIVDPETIAANTWYAVAAINALDRLTNFFYDFDDEPQFKPYVTSIFIRHAVSLPYSALSLTEKIDNYTILVSDFEYENTWEVGLGIYPYISMITHSADDANVTRHNLPNGQMAIITNRVIYPGEDLKFSLTNGLELLENDVVLRSQEVSEDYNYPVPYVPSTLKWSTFKDLTSPEREFLCPKCSETYAFCSLVQARLCKLPPPGENGLAICGNCSTSTLIKDLVAKADEIKDVMAQVEDLLNAYEFSKPIKAIRLTQKCIMDYQAILCPPSKEIQWAQVLLAQGFDFIITNA